MSRPTTFDTQVRPRRSRVGELSAFLRAFVAEPDVIGSILPSSSRLAAALARPFAQRSRPSWVLEIGAGTGAVTRHLGRMLGPEDRLSVCEVQADLVAHLQREVLSQPFLAPAVEEGRVELLAKPVQEIDRSRRFDYVISGLPFTAFEPSVIRDVLDVVRSVIRPGGMFSYFEYVGLRRLRTLGSMGRTRERMRQVSAVLDEHVSKYQVRRRTVLWNLPPAHARHWQFSERELSESR